MSTRRELIEGAIINAVRDLLYYDRKEDEELGTEDIASAIAQGEITEEEMVNVFRKELENPF